LSIARIAKAAQCSSGAKQTAIAALDATEAAGSAGESTPKGCRTWLLAERAAGLKCRVLAANRSPVADPAPAETVFPLAELDRMLPLCDTVLISCGLAPETKGLLDARRLALMKPGALLINVARAGIVDEDALYAALKDGRLGGAALDVWWQYPTPAEPERRPSRRPFHELPNVLITPHSSSSTEATADRRWSMVAANLDRFARGEKLENIVLQT
jgi:phosphoglycerate dehydrogenase-like enzyme